MSPNRPPCRQKDGADCPMRRIGCQGKCEAYLAYASENKKRLADNKMNYIISNVAHVSKQMKNKGSYLTWRGVTKKKEK